MPDRRFLIAGALALATAPALAQQDQGPQQLVRRFYRRGFDERTMPLSRALRQLAEAAKVRSDRADAPVAGLDFAWTTYSQDEVEDVGRGLVVRTIVQTLGNAVVEARLRDPRPQVIQYRVVKEEGRWVIDDIEYPHARERLAKLLARRARGDG